MEGVSAKISIVIPVYNAGAYLPRVMESLRSQTIGFEALQIFFCDDCSTDDSYTYEKEMASTYPNVTALQTARNSGFAGAPRNLALEQLTTPYVMFLDNDDALLPDACEILYREAEKSGADLVTGRYQEVSETGEPLAEYGPGCSISDPRKEYHFPADYDKIQEVRQIFWCKLYRTSCITQNHLRFKPDSSMEDVLFLAQYLMHCQTMVFLNHLVYRFTVRSGSLSHSHTASFLAGRAADFLLLYQIYADSGHPACFDQECRYDADHYLSLIFTSNRISDSATRRHLLETWAPVVRLSLTRGLFVADEQERKLFEALVQGDYPFVLQEFPQYLLLRTTARLTQAQQELRRIDQAYQGALNTCRALQAERDAVQAKLNRWPLYRLAKAVRHVMPSR